MQIEDFKTGYAEAKVHIYLNESSNNIEKIKSEVDQDENYLEDYYNEYEIEIENYKSHDSQDNLKLLH